MKMTLRKVRLMTRAKIAISAGIGLFSSVLVAVICTIIRYFWLPALLPQPKIAWVLFGVLGLIALIEIPLMTYGLRQIIAGKKAGAVTPLLFGISGFVFFSAIYALPNLLLTDYSLIWMGQVLAATSLLRLGACIFFLGGD